MADTGEIVARFWTTCEKRDWEGFGALLAEDVLYEAPMSRERVRGREAYVAFNRDGFPGDWHLTVERLVADGDEAVTRIRFEQDGEAETGISFFTVGPDGLISAIADYWPEAYEPPANRSALVERY